jgi:osmotically-inducible protein OsmY
VGEDGARSGSVLGTALAAVAAFAAGAVAGMALGGSVGAVHGERVRNTLNRLRRAPKPVPPEEIEREVQAALREDEATRDLDIGVTVSENGLVELTGVVTTPMARRAAGDVARAVPSVLVVVNRILLRETDLPHPFSRRPV